MPRSWLRTSTCAFAVLLTGRPVPAHAQEHQHEHTAPPQAADARVVITVGERKLTAADVDRILKALPPQSRVYYSGPGRNILPQYLVRLELLTAEAEKLNVKVDPEVQLTLELARQSIVADAARKRLENGIPVSDEQLLELYQKRSAEFEEARIRHILIRTESSIQLPGPAPTRPPLPAAEARAKLEELRKQVLAGADFAELAQAHSDDLSTAGKGGDLGYVNRQTPLLPPVITAAYSIEKGKVSDIISTAYGYELIKLEDRRVRPLAEVRGILAAQVRQEKFEELMKKLQEEYKVVVDTDFFAAPAPAASPSVAPRSP